MITMCESCENSHDDNEKKKPYRWMCNKFPRIDNSNFVSRDIRLTDPYMYCKDINGGACPLWKEGVK